MTLDPVGRTAADVQAASQTPRRSRPEVFTVLFFAALAAFAALHSWRATTRYTRFSHDALNYADVARNLAAGDGLTQKAHFYSPPLPLEPMRFPSPFTIQPPGFPLLIAALAPLRLTFGESALLAGALGAAAMLVLAYLLARRLWGGTAGAATVALLAASFPFERMSAGAWSEGPALALALGSLLVLLSPGASLTTAVAAGLLAGGAFGIRYAMLVALPIGAWLVWETSPRERWFRRLVAFGAGFALLAVLVVAHNWWATGRLSGILRHDSPLSLWENLTHTVDQVAGYWMARRGNDAQRAAMGLGVAVVIGLGWRRLRAGGVAARLEGLPFLWAAVYVITMAVLHSLRYFVIDARIATPAQVFLMIAFGGALGLLLPLPPRYAHAAAAVLLATLAAGELRTLGDTPRTRQRWLIESSPGLMWARHNLGERDLVVGWNTLGISYYLRRHTVSLYAVPAPEPRTFGFEHVCVVVRAAQDAGFEQVYLMAHIPKKEPIDVRLIQGEFLSDLVRSGAEKHPGVQEVARLSDYAFFRAPACR